MGVGCFTKKRRKKNGREWGRALLDRSGKSPAFGWCVEDWWRGNEHPQDLDSVGFLKGFEIASQASPHQTQCHWLDKINGTRCWLHAVHPSAHTSFTARSAVTSSDMSRTHTRAPLPSVGMCAQQAHTQNISPLHHVPIHVCTESLEQHELLVRPTKKSKGITIVPTPIMVQEAWYTRTDAFDSIVLELWQCVNSLNPLARAVVRKYSRHATKREARVSDTDLKYLIRLCVFCSLFYKVCLGHA